MCGFCHAPEHAYEALLDAELGSDGLCNDATERLLIALADEPPATDTSIEWAWSEESHSWIAWRHWGNCATCGARTWRYANESCAHECARCVARAAELAYLVHVLVTGYPLTDAELEDALAGPPRRRDAPNARNWLVFSDYSVPDSRLFADLPGPRHGASRPRILFGYASRPVRGGKRPEA